MRTRRGRRYLFETLIGQYECNILLGFSLKHFCSAFYSFAVYWRQQKILLFSGFSGRSNYFLLTAGKDDSVGATKVTDVADFTNPTHSCQKIADFPVSSDWVPQGGWVDDLLIVCSPQDDKKCFSLSADGKFTMILISFISLTLFDLTYILRAWHQSLVHLVYKYSSLWWARIFF